MYRLKILQIEVQGEASLLTLLDGASEMFPGAVTAFWGDLATVASSVALCQGRMNSLLFVLTFHCEWRGWALVLSGWAGVLHKEAKPASNVCVWQSSGRQGPVWVWKLGWTTLGRRGCELETQQRGHTGSIGSTPSSGKFSQFSSQVFGYFYEIRPF